MFARLLWAPAALFIAAQFVLAQAGAVAPGNNGQQSAWHASRGEGVVKSGPATAGANVNEQSAGSPSRPVSSTTATGSRPPIARVTRGSGTLPNDHGQVWREYDIRPYTLRVTSTVRPERAIQDWILRETGSDVWFSEPLGFFSVDRDRLVVYHTPDMQRLISETIDRFVNSQAESHVFGVRLVTIGSPNWRAKALRILHPVTVQSPGVQAWLLSKEDAAVLVANLRKRTDYREHNSPNLLIHNGQSQTVSRIRPRDYVRSVSLHQDAWPGYQPEIGRVDEGFSLQLSPLLSLDGQMIDAVIKCSVDQVEEMLAVWIDVPTVVAPRQRAQIQVPQRSNWRLHERFRWPVDQVLLISCGIVAAPAPGRPRTMGFSNPFSTDPPRVEALLFVESKGKANKTLPTAVNGQPGGGANYRGRY